MRWRRTQRFLMLAIGLISFYIFGFVQLNTAIDDNELDSSDLILDEVPSNRLLDIEDFRFLKNSSRTCASDDVFLLAFVHSAPSNFAKRDIIRETWASSAARKKLPGLRVVFIVGLINDSGISSLLDRESVQHEDIVQGTFVDSYRNLTYKHLAGYKWVLDFCSNARFVMKVDDDAFVDPFQIVKLLQDGYDTSPESSRPVNVLACSLFPNGTLAKRQGKWALTIDEYAGDYYPAYCSGIAYFLTPDVLSQLFVTAHQLAHRFIWIDDLFITGIVADQIRVPHQQLNIRFVYDPKRLYAWLAAADRKPSPYLIGDIGDTTDWIRFMARLWTKTARVWL